MSGRLTHLYFSRLQIQFGFAVAFRLDLSEAKVRRQNLVWQKILILPIGLMRLLQLLEMIFLRRGHFRRVLYSLQLIPGWLRQIARADSKSVLIVRRIRDRLQNSICVNVGISWRHQKKMTLFGNHSSVSSEEMLVRTMESTHNINYLLLLYVIRCRNYCCYWLIKNKITLIR